MLTELVDRFQKVSRQRLAIGVALAAGLLAAAGLLYPGKPLIDNSEMSSQSRRGSQRYTPTPAEWASLTIQPVTERAFHTEHVTEGKIAVDEDRSTPVYSPYAGRVTRLLARPGDSVTQGQPLFVIEATDKVQAQYLRTAIATCLRQLGMTKSSIRPDPQQDTAFRSWRDVSTIGFVFIST